MTLGVTHNSEQAMLDDFAYLLTQVDVLWSYNGYSFDMPYLMARADVTDSALKFISPFKKNTLFQTYHKTQWLADPKNGFKLFDLPGWWHLDQLKLVRKKEIEIKKSAKLKSVAVEVLGNSDEAKKLDLPATEIRAAWVRTLSCDDSAHERECVGSWIPSDALKSWCPTSSAIPACCHASPRNATCSSTVWKRCV